MTGKLVIPIIKGPGIYNTHIVKTQTWGPLNGEMTAFNYDSRNRLTEIGDTTYTYDANNNRTAVTEDQVTKRFIVNPNAALSQVLKEKDSQGNVTAAYVHGLGLISREDATGEISYYHYDLRGSTVALTDIDGNITDQYAYDAFGEFVMQDGATENPLHYNGRDGVITDNNGLYNMRARYYNPEIKRFINEDVVLGNIEIGQSLNRFAYVQGNPIAYIDPEGETPWQVASTVVGGAYGFGGQVLSDVVAWERSDWQTYLGSTAGGAAGGLTLSTTGNIVYAAGAFALTKNSVIQSSYYLTNKDEFSPKEAVIDATRDFSVSVITGIAGAIVKPTNSLHNHNWANRVIKNPRTALVGKYAQNQLWLLGGTGTGITGAMDGIGRITKK